MANPSNLDPPPSAAPSPAEIKAARHAAGLTQTQAGALVHVPCRTWQKWEADAGTADHRKMHPAFWELFLIKSERGE